MADQYSSRSIYESQYKRLNWQGATGIVLIAVFWPINWSMEGIRTHWAFFPLWFGYCLTVDGLTQMRKGDSLLKRNTREYILLYLISIPTWWLFEIINYHTGYWLYVGRETLSPIAILLLNSISFSTVIPAVFGTAELAGTLKWIRSWGKWGRIERSSLLLNSMFYSGWLMLLLLFLWPQYTIPFLWIGLYFVTEPANAWLGHPTLFDYTEKGDWRPILALLTGVMVCAFFWEMWNYFSYPKWKYTLPNYVSWFYIFEMPLLGYFGYFPFALELYALYHFIRGGFKKGYANHYFQLIPKRKIAKTESE